jgi:hypothetical protein
MNITTLLQQIFAPAKDTTPLATLALPELRERHATFTAQADTLDQEIAAIAPVVATATAAAAIGGIGAPSFESVEKDRARLADLRAARDRLRDVLAGVANEITARLADQDTQHRGAKRQAVRDAIRSCAAHTRAAEDYLRKGCAELAAADLERGKARAGLPRSGLGRFPMFIQEREYFVGIFGPLLHAWSGGLVGRASLQSAHEVMAARPMSDQVEELEAILPEIVFAPTEVV